MNWLTRMLRGVKNQPPPQARLAVVFYTRHGCPPCAETSAQLLTYESQGKISLEVRDVDANPAWAERYGTMVPVIEVGGQPRLWGKIEAAWLHRLVEHPAKSPN